MTLELPLAIDRYQDESRPNPDGQTVTNYRTVQFRLGKFGPFIERFPKETFTDADFQARVSAIRQTLEQSHRA